MIESLLERLGIPYKRYEHQPLHDCLEADRLGLQRSGTRLKNLFLRDNYGRRHFLLLTRHDKAVDLKALSRQLGISRLGFASNERLEKYLGVKPGSVSLLALVNDSARQVELWLDEEIWQAEEFQCHPLVNTVTLVLPKSGLLRFCEHLGHKPLVLEVPGAKQGKGR
ncbi:prolyl-tRNA synthetase associated domain-containing protein [Gallaecimonas sp. GXIMD4217]|uniref:prolyl-tRNA synthetase associated domain-containing protein n=1 Tax=Gallaecimonas sp. GXIMD4217 TaxID=3131927 RepID=UPI00311AC6F9